MDPVALSREIGEKIAHRRKLLGLTQANLAERIEVDPESVSRFERGKHLPSVPTLANIAVQLGTSVGALMSSEPAPPDQSVIRPLMETLTSLEEEDQAFVLKAMEELCGHLTRRSP